MRLFHCEATMPPVRVAVVQAGSALFDTSRTLGRLTTEAAGRGAALTVLLLVLCGEEVRTRSR
jgi:hypothetical protein